MFAPREVAVPFKVHSTLRGKHEEQVGVRVVGVPGSLLEGFELAVTCLVVFASDLVLTDRSNVLELEFQVSEVVHEGSIRFRQDGLNRVCEACRSLSFSL